MFASTDIFIDTTFDRENCFEIVVPKSCTSDKDNELCVTSEFRTYVFACETLLESFSWVEAINDHIRAAHYSAEKRQVRLCV